MASAAMNPEEVYQSTLVNYLVSMARSVEGAVNRAVEALLRRNEQLASEIFRLEPQINEMELVIDEYAVRILRGMARSGARLLPPTGTEEQDIRLLVATLRINNDLERMGDLAVNIAQRVLELAQMRDAESPAELAPMCAAVRAMVSRSLGALIYRNTVLAVEVLESDDTVDHYRDHIFERLLEEMTGSPAKIAPSMQFVLATRYLERIADHTTNIAEDILYWLRGLEVRHGRGAAVRRDIPVWAPSTPETTGDSGDV